MKKLLIIWAWLIALSGNGDTDGRILLNTFRIAAIRQVVQTGAADIHPGSLFFAAATTYRLNELDSYAVPLKDSVLTGELPNHKTPFGPIPFGPITPETYESALFGKLWIWVYPSLDAANVQAEKLRAQVESKKLRPISSQVFTVDHGQIGSASVQFDWTGKIDRLDWLNIISTRENDPILRSSPLIRVNLSDRWLVINPPATPPEKIDVPYEKLAAPTRPVDAPEFLNKIITTDPERFPSSQIVGSTKVDKVEEPARCVGDTDKSFQTADDIARTSKHLEMMIALMEDADDFHLAPLVAKDSSCAEYRAKAESIGVPSIAHHIELLKEVRTILAKNGATVCSLGSGIIQAANQTGFGLGRVVSAPILSDEKLKKSLQIAKTGNGEVASSINLRYAVEGVDQPDFVMFQGSVKDKKFTVAMSMFEAHPTEISDVNDSTAVQSRDTQNRVDVVRHVVTQRLTKSTFTVENGFYQLNVEWEYPSGDSKDAYRYSEVLKAQDLVEITYGAANSNLDSADRSNNTFQIVLKDGSCSTGINSDGASNAAGAIQ